MTPVLAESFEYQHKKFDQSKRLRSDSLSSSNHSYDSIKLEIGEIHENSYHKTEFEKTPTLNLYAVKTSNRLKRTYFESISTQEDSSLLPPEKKPCLRPLNATISTTVAAAVVPPTTAILPKISDEILRSICKYHGNMVRKFPKKERTPKDQERRNKNTIACRMSRRVRKLEHIAIEEQYKEFSQQTVDIVEECVRAAAYLYVLLKLKTCSSTSEIVKTENSEVVNEKTCVAATAPQRKKPFTIAFLTGNDE